MRVELNPPLTCCVCGQLIYAVSDCDDPETMFLKVVPDTEVKHKRCM